MLRARVSIGNQSRWAMAATMALVMVIAAPEGATGTGDFTGDVTPPSVVSFTVSAPGADVTSADATFSVAIHVTDDLSGAQVPALNWSNAHGAQGGMGLALTSGDRLDGIWTGSFAIPRYSPPGRYALSLTMVLDFAGNQRWYDAAHPLPAGSPTGVDITDANPDAAAPVVTQVLFTPSTVDARTDPGRAQVTVTVSDSQSGVAGVLVTPLAGAGGFGGAGGPSLSLVSGDANNGIWTGFETFPLHTRNGHWTLTVQAYDRVNNLRNMNPSDLQAAGLTSGFDVLSNEDVQPPRFVSLSVTPTEVNVHDADQIVTLTAHVTDDLTGVQSISAEATDPLTGQRAYVGVVNPTSGTVLDAYYSAPMIVRRASATGLRPFTFTAWDFNANRSSVYGAAVVALGGPPSLLVYNVPSPPTLVRVDPAGGSAVIRWSPPVDDHGSPVTGYLIRVSPGGVQVGVGADARSIRVPALAPGQVNALSIQAVNKAGASDPAVPSPLGALASGYWMLSSSGAVYAFGGAAKLGDAPSGSSPAVHLEPTPSRLGYWVVNAAGQVFAFGEAPYLGGSGPLRPGEVVTSLSATPSGRGYWLFTNKGRVITFGDAPHLGDMSDVALNGPVLNSVATPDGGGYYMVASDGGVFAFGTARFAGSMGGSHLNAPVESLVANPTGPGYWLAASDGGIFSFGVPFYGSMGSTRLNQPITGMVGSATGHGYLMVAADGGIFAFGDTPFSGSLGASPPPLPIVSAAML